VDGKELYYLNPAGAMMAALITVTEATLEPGASAVLFPTRIVCGGVDAALGRQYDGQTPARAQIRVGRRVPIPRPLPDVAVHVIDSPHVRIEGANRRRLP
jgi:hypothetical protein